MSGYRKLFPEKKENLSETDKVLNEARRLIKERLYFDALSLCSQEKYYNDVEIQSERIFLLIKYYNNYEGAYRIWEHYKDINNPHMIVHGMSILAELYSMDEALNYCNKFNNDNIFVVRRKVKFLYKLGRYEEAKKICNDPKYMDDESILDLKIKIAEKINECNVMKVDLVTDSISDYLTRIYIDSISLEEIENSALVEDIKTVLKIAYYEKNNSKLGLKLIKELKDKNAFDYTKRRILNDLYNKLSSKKAQSKLFDITIYGKLLGRDIDYDLVIKHNIDKDKEKDVIVEPIKEDKEKEEIIRPIVEKKKKVKEKKNFVTVGGGITNSRYNRVNTNSNININNMQLTKHINLIKEVFTSEIEEINIYIASKLANKETRNKAITAWDNLQILINRPITDLDSVMRLYEILISLNKDNKEIVDMYNKKLEKIIK